MLSPFGPALKEREGFGLSFGLVISHLQLGGGSNVISASSFWMRLAEVVSALEDLGAALASFLALSPPPEEEVVAMAKRKRRSDRRRRKPARSGRGERS